MKVGRNSLNRNLREAGLSGGKYKYRPCIPYRVEFLCCFHSIMLSLLLVFILFFFPVFLERQNYLWPSKWEIRGEVSDGASLVAQVVKNLPAIWETWVRFLDWEDLLEEGMAIHSSILDWNPMDRGAWWATVHGVTKCQDWVTVSTQTKHRSLMKALPSVPNSSPHLPNK